MKKFVGTVLAFCLFSLLVAGNVDFQDDDLENQDNDEFLSSDVNADMLEDQSPYQKYSSEEEDRDVSPLNQNEENEDKPENEILNEDQTNEAVGFQIIPHDGDESDHPADYQLHIDVPHKLQRGNRLGYLPKIPYQGKCWGLSVDIKPFGVTKGWGNVLYLTQFHKGIPHGKLRVGIWFHDWTTKLRICAVLNDQKKCVSTPPLPLTKYTNVKLTQTIEGSRFVFAVYICDLKVMEYKFTHSHHYRDINVFASAPWEQPAKAFVKNVFFETDPYLIGLVQSDALVRVIPFQERAWSLSFSVLPLEKISGWASLIHLTTGGNIGQYGYRTPGVWFKPGTTALHICAPVNNKHNHCFNTHHLPLDVFTEVTIIQKSLDHGYTYWFYIFVNHKKVYAMKNHNAQIFRNVKVYCGDPWYSPAFAVVREVKFQNLPIIPYKIEKSKVIDFIPLQTPYYELSFDLKAVAGKSTYESVLHFTIGGNSGKPGFRTPGVWILNGKQGPRLHICAPLRGRDNYCWNSKYQFSKIRITQQVVKGKIFFQIFVNGKQEFSIENNTPLYFNDVTVYNGDPWYHPANAVIQNYQYRNLPTPYTWFDNLKGKKISISSIAGVFLHALSNGTVLFKAGQPDYFVVEVAAPFCFVLKSSYDKYLIVKPNGQVLANRVKPEVWEVLTVVFFGQNRVAFLSYDHKYLKRAPHGEIKTHGNVIGPEQIFTIQIKPLE